MATHKPTGSPKNKEVFHVQRPAPKTKEHDPVLRNGQLRKALLLAAGLTLGGSIPAALHGCGEGEKTDESIGKISQALSTGWNAPTTPNLGLVGNSGITRVERSGSNITVYVVNNPASNADILKVGTTDGTNWNSPSATPVPGANSVQHDTDFKVCGTDAYIVSERDGLSSKLYKGSWSGGTVGVLSPVPGTINSDFSNVQSVACNNAETKIYATSDVTSANLRIHTADIGTWTWSEVTSCNDPTKDIYEMFVDANDFYFSSNRGGTLGSFDLMAMKWDGTNCSAPLTNINSIVGSAAVNNVNYQGSPVIDNQGDLWFTDNGVIKWATAKSVVLPDGGTDGGGGEGGSDAGACPGVTIQNPANVTITNCTATQLNTEIKGPATVQVGNKTFNFTEGQGTFDFAQPNLSTVSVGLAHEDSEPPSETDKIISKEGGIWLGFEGTKTSTTYPGALNPNKAKGVFDIVAYTTIDGSQSAYDSSCVPVSNSVSSCNPVDFMAPGSSKKGQIPKGITMYRELSTGQIADDPSKFNTIPPIQADPPGGCHCATVQNGTSNEVDAVLMAAGLIGLITRRKRNGTKS